jgi:superfamily I DNA and/or RNA helicase
LHPFESATEIFLPEARALFTAQLRAWRQRLDEYEAISARFDSLLTAWIKDVEKVTPHERAWLEDLYIQNANVIGITCGQVDKLGRPDRSGNGVVINGHFDAVIIDEVSKATAPELLLPAMRGRKLILIGDHRQLPPVMEERTLDEMAEAEGKDPRSYDFLKQSYFKDRFLEAPPELKCQLTIQYRMHPDIMAAINQFYDIPLECGLTDPNVERHHGLTQSNLVRPNKHIIWVATPLARYTYQRQNERHLILHNRNTGNEALRIQTRYAHFGEGKVGTSYYNEREIEIIEGICEDLQRSWYAQVKAAAKPKEIGVITFYGEQDKRLRQRLLPDQRRQAGRKPFDALAIRVGTVDRFQGMERPVVIVSMVRNNTEGEIGFAKEDERINVAFSRAQELLIIVGCHELFCEYGKSALRYRKVAEIVKKLGEFIDVSAS